MLPREQTPVNPHGSADHRGLPRLFIPPPPSTPPPARLTLNRMGVFDPSPQPAAQPITQGRQWGDPSNITSFVTPYHVAPTKMDCIGSVTQPVLVTSSWRGTAVPIHQIWKELDLDHTAGHDAARDARKEYKHGWGSLRTALRPTKKRPDLSVFGNPELPVSPSHRTATVYPSPPSSPPKPTSKSTGRGFGGSLARKMGQVMRTFEPTHPTIQEEQQQQQYNETLERRNRLRLGQDPAAVTYHPTIGKKRSSEMEEFRAMLLQTYADDK
ncbi:hypothetical protein DFJ77DRAFT_470319 [Powellomyces hirtus]|nr:hypothetical protein DFJ77DRAFT_470319 [Powellomyces hirtus]